MTRKSKIYYSQVQMTASLFNDKEFTITEIKTGEIIGMIEKKDDRYTAKSVYDTVSEWGSEELAILFLLRAKPKITRSKPVSVAQKDLFGTNL